MVHDIAMIREVYARMGGRLAAARALFNRPLTFAEKILCVHFAQRPASAPVRKETYVYLTPDRVAMQDATAQMALLQFMHAGRARTAVPATVHCDHLVRTEHGAGRDLERALAENDEVYGFLRSITRKYGIGFWKPGAGIIHQIVLENYAFPGGLMIGTDSHTPNAGGLGMAGVGVGGADAVDVMAGMPWEVKWPGIIGVRLTGRLQTWTSPKDVILYLLGKLSVKGGTGKIVEYYGEGASAISCTGKATIANMGAELGATCSLFPFDAKMAVFLQATGRQEVAALADKHSAMLTADPEVLVQPEAFYDTVIEIDLSTLEPQVVGPHTPDLARPISKLREEARINGYPEELSAGLVGSCTNASYEDLGKAAHVAAQALKAGVKSQAAFYITPGSELIRATAERDGYLATLTAFGGMVCANACGQCIGQWTRNDPAKERKNSIVTTFNRNFAKRNDGSPNTLAFIASPELVTAMAASGQLTFNPNEETIETANGTRIKLAPPAAAELPLRGFVQSTEGLVQPHGSTEKVDVRPGSERLQLLEPFAPWDGKDLSDLSVLLKIKGKCTTDHISPAGPWLKYRGHLDHISDNMLTAATNAFTGKPAKEAPQNARALKAAGRGWVVIGDENYGEGSSREHAAMSPRFLGCRAVIAKSFARIHETNLKKQGILPLTFSDPGDYDKVRADDMVAIEGIVSLIPGKNLEMVLRHANGGMDRISLAHTLSTPQIEWFKAGSALNLIAQQQCC